jgi:hypothetical protein
MHHLPLEAGAVSASNGRAPTARTEIARLNGEVARLEALCRRQGAALDLLTKMLRRVRRGGLALRDQNAELRDELRQLRTGPARRRRPARR